MLKVDLHTHSIASQDGSISYEQYRIALAEKKLDCIAITDHNRIDFAQKVQSQLGKSKIIIGQEITTKQGDIIGLFLSSPVEPDQDIAATIKAIKAQGGLVYVPHPYETVRSGISRQDLQKIQTNIDIIETINGRAFFQNFSQEITNWAQKASLPTAASSDAHRGKALGKTFTTIQEAPSSKNLTEQLFKAKLSYARPSFFDIIAPKMNKLKKILRGNQ